MVCSVTVHLLLGHSWGLVARYQTGLLSEGLARALPPELRGYQVLYDLRIYLHCIL